MKLLKIHVHEYRCLKDVFINFEQDLRPQIFPIGGENGSGKSTLLQLIFTLLHCSLVPDRREFLNNAIKHINSPHERRESLRHDIATIELSHQNKQTEFNFFLAPLNDSEAGKLMKELTDKREKYRAILQKALSLSTVLELEHIRNVKNPLEFLLPLLKSEVDRQSHEKAAEESGRLKKEIESLEKQVSQDSEASESLLLSVAEFSDEDYGLFCQASCDHRSAKEVLACAGNHIFLAGQSTQPYIFLTDNAIQELFSPEGNYENSLKDAGNSLPNFYNCNPFSVLKILEALRDARDKDFQQVDKTGTYGNAYNSLTKELRNLLGNEKYISVTPQLDAIIVRHKRDEKFSLDLGPGDLSHGELKRLSLYSWIKHRKIADSVVLIDEIENGLHPDWQYGIVRELASWGDNQYLLGTHSFYLCEALTPRHVKELEPGLRYSAAKREENVAEV